MNILKSSIIVTILISLFSIFNNVNSSLDSSSASGVNTGLGLLYAVTANTNNNAQELVVVDLDQGIVTFNHTFFFKDPISSIINVDLERDTVLFLAQNDAGSMEYLFEYSLQDNNYTIKNTIEFVQPNCEVVSEQVIFINNVAYLNPFCEGDEGGQVELFAWDFNANNFTATILNLPQLNTKLGFWTIDPFLAYDNITDSFFTGYFSTIHDDEDRLIVAQYPRTSPANNTQVYYNLTDLNVQNLMKIFSDGNGNIIAATQGLDLQGTTRFCQINFETQICETKLVLNMGPLFNNSPYVLNQDKTKITLIINNRIDHDSWEITIEVYDLATWTKISPETISLPDNPWMRVYANLYTYFYYI